MTVLLVLSGCSWPARWRGEGGCGEHDVALEFFSHQPCGAREEVGISDVVPVKVRERHVSDGGPGHSRFRPIEPEGPGGGRISKRSRSTAGLNAVSGTAPRPKSWFPWMGHEGKQGTDI